MTVTNCPKCGLPFPDDLLAWHEAECTEPEKRGSDADVFADIAALIGTDQPEPDEPAKERTLDEMFFDLVDGLDVDLRTITQVDVQLLDDPTLCTRYGEVREELLERGEMLKPTTDTGRDLHSQRAAFILEMRRRGLQ